MYKHVGWRIFLLLLGVDACRFFNSHLLSYAYYSWKGPQPSSDFSPFVFLFLFVGIVLILVGATLIKHAVIHNRIVDERILLSRRMKLSAAVLDEEAFVTEYAKETLQKQLSDEYEKKGRDYHV